MPIDDSFKPPSPADRVRFELESAAEQIVRGLPEFARRKRAVMRELERAVKRTAKGRSRSPEQTKADKMFETKES